jgi:hypothetical protein
MYVAILLRMFYFEFRNRNAKWHKHIKCFHVVNKNILTCNLAVTEGCLRRVTIKKFKTNDVAPNGTTRPSVLQLSCLWNSDDRLDVYLLFVIEENPRSIQFQKQITIESLDHMTVREIVRSRLRVDQCVCAVIAEEIPVFCCLCSSCYHVTDMIQCPSKNRLRKLVTKVGTERSLEVHLTSLWLQRPIRNSPIHTTTIESTPEAAIFFKQPVMRD